MNRLSPLVTCVFVGMAAALVSSCASYVVPEAVHPPLMVPPPSAGLAYESGSAAGLHYGPPIGVRYGYYAAPPEAYYAPPPEQYYRPPPGPYYGSSPEPYDGPPAESYYEPAPEPLPDDGRYYGYNGPPPVDEPYTPSRQYRPPAGVR